jgi:hypothetical protein
VIKNYVQYCFGITTTRGGAAAARVAHNHKVAGSSPAPATISTLASVFTTEVFLPNFSKKLIGSSPIRSLL